MTFVYRIATNPITFLMLSGFVILLFGRSKEYINIKDIIVDYVNCFYNSKTTLIFLWLLPAFLAQATNYAKLAVVSVVEIITIILSIFTAMLFTAISLLDTKKNEIKQLTDYTKSVISESVRKETYAIIYYEILISVALLIFCFLIPISNDTPFVSNDYFYISAFTIMSYLLYLALYHFLLNLLIVIKRTFLLDF